jgi:CheY-like chemotaxis protein
VLVAVNGADAVDLVMATPAIGLVIMDIEMPVMDGLEATQRIRRFEQQRGGRHVPIVGLSGNARQVQTPPEMHMRTLGQALHRWQLQRVCLRGAGCAGAPGSGVGQRHG